MAKFLKGNELNAEVENIFEQAKEYIYIISPFIKLHQRYISALLTHKSNPKVSIVIVFGKNADDLTKSMIEEDFKFFKEFPCIEIRYEKRLHAKYYANEDVALLTSMNLYDYSQDNNIEVGVKAEAGNKDIDKQAFDYFNKVIKQSEVLFQKAAKYEYTMFGLKEKYISSEILIDKLSDFFANKVSENTHLAYCIRTAKRIPFNIQKPFCEEAYQNWAKFSNKDYKEKYCHFSGEPSNGETSMSKPILKKNWNEAQRMFSFIQRSKPD